jgi:hypothetical protein
MFGYVDALRRVGVRTVLVCISARVARQRVLPTPLLALRFVSCLRLGSTAHFDAKCAIRMAGL